MVLASGGRQPLLSGRHIPDAHSVNMVSLQFPLPSQVGVTILSALAGQDATPHTVPSG